MGYVGNSGQGLDCMENGNNPLKGQRSEGTETPYKGPLRRAISFLSECDFLYSLSPRI